MRLTPAMERLDRWMRTSFVDANTLLEEAYFAEGRDVLDGRADLDAVKTAQVREGAELVARVADEDRLPTDPDGRYELLGMVGYVLGACRRHEVDLVDTVGSTLAKRVWTTASRLGSSLGVAPRFVFAHQALFNTARRDSFRTFTSLPDEAAFLRSNGLAVLAYRRAAHSLRQISPMGVSNPMAAYLLENARSALGDVLRFNQNLSETVDVTRFYLNIRPYFKPYLVGGVEWRGANAGDFAAINEIDVMLGLCDPRDAFYQRILAEKQPYVPPRDQPLLRAVGTRRSLLALLLDEAGSSVTPQLAHNSSIFLDVCKAHGAAYSYHHTKLVQPYLERPAENASAERLATITASGPPLAVVIEMLDRLRLLRLARDSPDVPTARASLDRLAELTSR